MTLQVQVSGDPNDLKICMRRLYTGRNDDDPNHKQLHEVILSVLEPAVYEAIRGSISRGVLSNATVYWDGQTLELRSKSSVGVKSNG